MKPSKRWVFLGVLIIAPLMALVLSLSSTALAQEARWKALHNQAKALNQQGKYREALPVAKEALNVAENTFGPDHPNVAISINELALLYKAQGGYAQE